MLGTYVSLLGRELCVLGRFDEAEALARRGRELAPDDNLDAGLWRQVQARILAHRGEHSEAERLTREAMARAEETDNLPWQGDAWYEIAEVLEAAGRRDDAIEAWREALDRYERKGIIPLMREVRERLAALESG
jgi:tetratricopeptide (TPR) repeat protein